MKENCENCYFHDIEELCHCTQEHEAEHENCCINWAVNTKECPHFVWEEDA